MGLFEILYLFMIFVTAYCDNFSFPVVSYNGVFYAALDGTHPDNAMVGCQYDYLPLPDGWMLAEEGEATKLVANSFDWGTHVVTTAGRGYNTKACLSCSPVSQLTTDNGNGEFKPDTCYDRVLIQTTTWKKCNDLPPHTRIVNEIEYEKLWYNESSHEIFIKDPPVGFFRLIRKVVVYLIHKSESTGEELSIKSVTKLTRGTSEFPIKASNFDGSLPSNKKANFVKIKFIAHRVGTDKKSVNGRRGHHYKECVVKPLSPEQNNRAPLVVGDPFELVEICDATCPSNTTWVRGDFYDMNSVWLSVDTVQQCVDQCRYQYDSSSVRVGVYSDCWTHSCSCHFNVTSHQDLLDKENSYNGYNCFLGGEGTNNNGNNNYNYFGP